MKLRIVGGPAEGKIEVESDATTNFAAIMVLAESAIGKGVLHDKYIFYRGEIVDKKAKAIAVVAPTDTPQSVGLPAHGALLVLKAKDGSPQSTPRELASAKPRTPRALTFRERMIAIYEAYEPSKVSTVDGTLEKYKGKEEAVIKKLVEKYGPEPTPAQSASSPSSHPSTQNPAGSGGDMVKKSAKERMVAMYQKYDPAKVGTVDATLEKFKGKEEAVIKKLVEKYGPEPVDNPPSTAAAPAPTVSSPTNVSPPAAPPTLPDPEPSPPAQSGPSARSFRDRMIAVYELYEPSKVSTVDATLAKYKGKEEAVIKKLIEKYGPEPATPSEPTAPSEQPSASVEASKRDRSKSLATSATPSNEEPLASEPPGEATDGSVRDRSKSEIRGRAKSVVAPPGVPLAADDTHVEKEADPLPSNDPDGITTPPPSSDVPSGPAPCEPPTPHNSSPASPASEMHSATGLMKVCDPRFRSLMAAILGRVLDEANHHTLRSRFLIWMRHANEQKAEKLLAEGRWKRDPQDGAYECVDSSPPFKTPDLVAFLEEKKGTSRSQVLSDSLCDVLRVIIRKSSALVNPDVAPMVPVTFRDDASTVDQIASQCIYALDMGKESHDHLQSLQVKHATLTQQHDELRAAHSIAVARLGIADPAVERAAELKKQLDHVSAELHASKSLCAKQEVDIKLLTTDLAKTQKDLDMERRGLPTNMEVIVRQKDSRLASLEQEITKLRLKVKQQQTTTVQQAQRIRELESDVSLLERSRSVVAFSRRSAMQSASPMTARQRQSSLSPDLAQPKTYAQSFRSSPRGFEWCGQNHAATTPGRSPSSRPVPPIAVSLIGLKAAPSDSATDGSLSYEPSARPSRVEATPPAACSPHTARDIRDLVIRSEILEQELSNQPLPVADHVGNCPHCSTTLTSLRGGDGSSQRAFCFSCRRSFTFDELAEYAKPKSRSRAR